MGDGESATEISGCGVMLILLACNGVDSLIIYRYPGETRVESREDTMTKVTEPRSVSHGTMREEDLIPRFMRELEDRQNDNLYTADGDEAELVALNTRITDLLARIESRMESETDYYATEGASWDLESLFDALDLFAGDGLTFGAHPGDGSDYGYWPVESDDDDRAANSYKYGTFAALAALEGPGHFPEDIA